MRVALLARPRPRDDLVVVGEDARPLQRIPHPGLDVVASGETEESGSCSKNWCMVMWSWPFSVGRWYWLHCASSAGTTRAYQAAMAADLMIRALPLVVRIARWLFLAETGWPGQTRRISMGGPPVSGGFGSFAQRRGGSLPPLSLAYAYAYQIEREREYCCYNCYNSGV